MVTQKDISAVCGVSVAAVSKALSDHSDIAEETKKRIREVAEKMGYIKQKEQDRKVKNKTYTIGLVVAEEAETVFHQAVMSEIRRQLTRRGYDLITFSPMQSEDMKVTRPGYLSRCRLYGLEGIFLFSSIIERDLYNKEEFHDIRDLVFGEIPVIAVDCNFASCYSVIPGYESGVQRLFKSIYEMGHRRIAFVYGESRARKRIVERVFNILLEEHNLHVPSGFFKYIEGNDIRVAYEKTKEILESAKWLYPTCIIFTNDYLLAGGAAAIRDAGLKMPEDITPAAIRFLPQDLVPGVQVQSWRVSAKAVAEVSVDRMLNEVIIHGAGFRRTITVEGVFESLESDSYITKGLDFLNKKEIEKQNMR